MRYLITGGAGYIGSNLVRTLIKNQENIINLIIRPDSDLKQLSDTKKFCNDQCRNTYNNRVNKTTNDFVRNINVILKTALRDCIIINI